MWYPIQTLQSIQWHSGSWIMTPSKSARSRRRTPGTRITDSIDSMGALPECASTKLWKKGSGTLWAEKWQAWCVSLQIFKAALNIYIHLQCLQYFNVLHMDQLKKLQGCSSDIFRSPEVIKMTASQVSKFLYKSPSVPSCDTTLKRTKLGSRLCSDTASSRTFRADRLKHTAYIIQYHTIYTFGPVTFCTWKWRYCGKIMKNMQKCRPMRDSHDSMHTSQNAVCFKSL